MQKLIITGGKPLRGDVAVSGAKNAALPLLASSLLTTEPVTFTNVPRLADVNTMLKLLEQLGCEVKQDGHEVTVNAAEVKNDQADYDLVRTMRASILVLCPLVARLGKARVSLPGGCSIGARPVDQHIKGLKSLGADITLEHGYISAHANRLKSCRIVTDLVTVTGTENLLMAATLADGETILENAAREPEVTDLAECLNSMGANISGIGTDRLVIKGVETLHGTKHHVVPDRIEAGSFLAAAAATDGDVTVKKCRPEHLSAITEKLFEAGVEVEQGEDWIRVKPSKNKKAVDFRTMPYPGFPTDMQAQFMVLDALFNGASRITETVFENRFMHVPELQRLGADIAVEGNVAYVRGVDKLSGAPLMCTDLRAGAALVIAALAADGESTVNRIYHLDRGYEKLEEKLASLGADIQRVNA